MSTIKQRSVLVADPDKTFTEALKADPATSNFPLKVATTGAEAQILLSDLNEKIMGIFVSPTLENPNWISVLKCSHLNRPGTPIYMILPDQMSWKEITEEDIKKLGIKDAIKRPISYADLVKLVTPIMMGFDIDGTVKKASSSDKVGAEVTGGDTDFIAIRAEDFVSGSKSCFDVYVLLGKSRYIKLLQAGDTFEADRLESYLNKGVSYFYIRKEMQETYVSYCDHIATALLKVKTAPMAVKVSQIANQGEETIKHFKLNGVSEANILYANKFVSNVRDLTKQLASEGGNIMSKLMSDILEYDHGVGTSMLAGILASHLKIASENPVQIVGSAALLHDIGLLQLPKELWDEEESKMAPEQIALYRTHPQIAVDLLSKIKSFNPAALQAISQHHMRLGNSGKGFPERTTGTAIHRLSEIIGICDEVNRLVIRCSKDPTLDQYFELENNVFPYFSRQVVQACKEAFYPNHYVKSNTTKVS